MVSFEQTVTNLLCNIKDELIEIRKLLGEPKGSVVPATSVGKYDVWDYSLYNGHVTFEKEDTLNSSGAALVTLIIPKWFVAWKLMRISMFFSTSNAKSFNIDIYSGKPYTVGKFERFITKTADTSIRYTYDFGESFKFPDLVKIELGITSGTPGDKVATKIVLEGI
jgi:hypothetical protein